MGAATYDLTAVGNAIVDVIFQTTDALLAEQNIAKNVMTLIDEARADELTRLFVGGQTAAGGSAANTATGLASFGGRAAFIGKVAEDALGRAYAEAFRAGGVTFKTPPRPGQPGTARSMIAVTPDGHRSMNTYLGASTLLEPHDIDRAMIEASSITFLEGYLFDREEAKAAFVQAAEYAKSAGRRVALTLSDMFCVERHRASFRHLVAGHVDILFANEAEILSLYETSDLQNAFEIARRECPILAVTRSEHGSIVSSDGKTIAIAAEPVAAVVDTTGAGDQYAAGFLFGLANEMPLAQCGKLGSIAAAEVISHVGPRPEVSLKALARLS